MIWHQFIVLRVIFLRHDFLVSPQIFIWATLTAIGNSSTVFSYCFCWKNHFWASLAKEVSSIQDIYTELLAGNQGWRHKDWKKDDQEDPYPQGKKKRQWRKCPEYHRSIGSSNSFASWRIHTPKIKLSVPFCVFLGIASSHPHPSNAVSLKICSLRVTQDGNRGSHHVEEKRQTCFSLWGRSKGVLDGSQILFQ